MSFSSSLDWDPDRNKISFNNDTPPYTCTLRIKRDMMSIYDDPPPGLFVAPDEKDLTFIHALVTGTFDTPYEGGFFYFVLRCPPDYPIRPPLVKLMTTGAGKVRFNPNLYKSGKVCLSILGTWSGPAWSPAQTLSSLLLSIQSLMTEKPYHNEPGFETERNPGDAARYNDIIRHETIRVAVCGMLDNDYGLKIPKSFVEAMEKNFLEFYDLYVAVCNEKMHLTGQLMLDPFGDKRGTFNYKALLERLQTIKDRLVDKSDSGSTSSSSPDSTITSGGLSPNDK
ncbi:ubiquitin-conjugating enzyme E2 Z-like [Nilaparvata lugens]|uniref:ubiquitin-conjugating enzyme E2 Z-like n=1 Tax=Nilaparvata lugens TaxID=108931 RepID=UPI00193E7E14|nr:ubiquitin-conjugating enzyme E2 Z-like [Nilaparvata lugens]